MRTRHAEMPTNLFAQDTTVPRAIESIRNTCPEQPVESKTRTYNERVGSGRTARRRSGANQDGTPTEQFAQETGIPRTPEYP